MGDIDTTTNSNGILLAPRQWAALALFAAALYLGAPELWKRLEPLEPAPDHRMPYALSNDTWLYERWAGRAEGTVVLGDSVVWGQYAPPDRTLTAALNRKAGRPRYANLGLDGAHPAALAGLIEHHAGAIRDRDVVLHCNLLWMSSPRADLSGPEPAPFNHPGLVPQFVPRIASYRAPLGERVRHGLDRRVPFMAWTSHLQTAYFDQTNVPLWTLDHPYENPLARLTLKLPPPEPKPHQLEISWVERGVKPQEFAWVGLDRSFQWRMFRRCVELLRARGNRVTVLIGPFNEHMIAPPSRPGYDRLLVDVQAWLREQGIPFAAPAPLPSELYGDASHPLGEGYERLAAQLPW
jgi:hypothetical protein